MNNFLGNLKELNEDDLYLILEWRNHPNIRKNMYTQHEITKDEHINWWNSVKSCAKKKYFIYENNNEKLGFIAFNQIDFENKTANWAFYASPNALNGVGSKMEFLALEFAFKDLQLNKLNCEVLAFNQSVIRLHQKFHFEIEGILKEMYFINENFIDVYLLGLLQKNWLKHSNEMFERLKRLTKNQ